MHDLLQEITGQNVTDFDTSGVIFSYTYNKGGEEYQGEVSLEEILLEMWDRKKKKKKAGVEVAARFKKLNDIDMMIKKVLETDSTLLKVDLIHSDQIAEVLETYYPDQFYFQYSRLPKVAYGLTKQQKAHCRSIAGRMTKLGYKTLRTRSYIPAQNGEPGHTSTRTVWVLRNNDRYEGLSELMVRQVVDHQWSSLPEAANGVSFL
jgi:hypothetical protein